MNILKKIFARLKKLKKALFIKKLRIAFFKYFVFGSVEHEYILGVTNPLLIVDIGANKGQFALAARVFSGANVISFEPLSKPAAKFRKIFENDSKVILHNVAIGPVREVVVMNIAARADSSSILSITDLQSKIYPGTSKVGEVCVNVGPLDDYVTADMDLSHALLKIDVQGYEFEVLKGCESLLERFKFIYCECSFVELYSGQRLANEIIGFLQSRGFKLTGIFNAFNDPSERLIQADFLFENNSASKTK